MLATEPCSQCGKLVVQADAVTISKAEYEELLSRPKPAPLYWKPSRSRIGRDQEMANFIRQLVSAGPLTLREIMDALHGRFEPGRIPSQSALHRFLHAEVRARRSARGI